VRTVLGFSLRLRKIESRKERPNLHPTGQKDASFSPYHDEDRLFDFLDDDAQRHASTAIIVFLVHVGLVLSLSGSFIVPDLKPPPEPEAVTIEIVTFEPEPEPEETPEPIIVEPTLAPPPPTAIPKPQPPKPQPEPTPQPRPEPTPPPPPEPEPGPEPLPEPVFTPPPPPPEILAQPEPIAPDPLPEPLQIPEPLPEPVIEIFEPVPEPILEPEPEPSLELFDPLPLPEPEPLLEPEPELQLEPLPDPILDPAPIIEIYEREPLPEPEPEPDFEPVIIDLDLAPTPGIIRAEPLPEIIEPEPLPPQIIVEPDPSPEPEIEPEPEPLQEPEFDPLPELDLIITAPTVLASPDAPETRAEERRAVPQEQSDPFLDLLKKDRDSTLDEPIASRPPARGGGNEGAISLGGSVNAPPGGGTQIGRSSPGAGSWSLGPQPTAPGNGYESLNLDIRCREEGRTHEDCPEYINRNRGRDRTGRESFDGHAGTGTDRGDRISASRRIPTRGEIAPNIGDPSVNSGGPSTGALDFQDTNFDREFLGTPLNNDPKPPGLIKRLTQPETNIPDNDWTLTPPPETPSDDNEETIDWVLNPDPKE